MVLSKFWFGLSLLLAMAIGFNLASLFYARHISQLIMEAEDAKMELVDLKAAEAYYIHEISVLEKLNKKEG